MRCIEWREDAHETHHRLPMDEDEDNFMKILLEGFPPPPPLPPHLAVPGHEASTLGDPTPLICNLCSWANPEKKVSTFGQGLDEGTIFWIILILIAVVVSSAFTAITMKFVPWCRRRFDGSANISARNANPGNIAGETNRVIENDGNPESRERSKMCSLLPNQNHYTHMEREHARQSSILNNEGSIPSSAYYSELSDFVYETIDLQTIPQRPFPCIRSSPNTTQTEYE